MDRSAQPATLVAMIKAATPGDVVHLEPGVYPLLKLTGVVKAAPGVTIRPASPASTWVAGLNINGCAGLTFDQVTATSSITIANSERIVFQNGRLDPGANVAADQLPFAPFPKGILVRTSKRCAVMNNEVTHTGIGISFYDNLGPDQGGHVAHGNHIHHIAGPDGFDTLGSRNVLIEGNLIDTICPTAEAHADACQVDALKGVGRSVNVRILNNRYERARGLDYIVIDGAKRPAQAAQGIAFAANTDGLEITGNASWGCLPNGVSVSNCTRVKVDDNFVAGYPGSSAKITVRGGAEDVMLTRNVSNTSGNYTPRGDPPLLNVVWDASNRTISTDTGQAEFAAWLKAHPLCGLSGPIGLMSPRTASPQ